MAYKRDRDSVCWYKVCGCACERGPLGCTILTILTVISVLLLIILLAISIHDIDHDEFAVAYNKFTCDFDSKVLTEGRHTLDPADSLLFFSNRVNTKEEDITCVSKNGLIATFTLSTQFRVNKPEAFDILYDWKNQGGLFHFLDFPIRDEARDACARFLGKEFFQQREAVEQDLAGNVSKTLEDGDYYVAPSFVRLKNIALPTKFLEAIQAVQEELENVQIEQSKRPGILIQAQTDLIAAIEDAKIKLLKAEAEGEGIEELAKQKGNARTTLWNERLASIQFGVQSLAMTPKDYVQHVLFPQLIAESTSPGTQACLESCTGSDCWFCWVGSVAVSPVSV